MRNGLSLSKQQARSSDRGAAEDLPPHRLNRLGVEHGPQAFEQFLQAVAGRPRDRQDIATWPQLKVRAQLVDRLGALLIIHEQVHLVEHDQLGLVRELG
mgnify:CR=1 FL=1